MKTIFDHIEHIKGKPHHVRKRLAFGAAAVGAGLIALVWLVGSVSSGVFALKDTSFADSVGAGVAITTQSGNNSQGLAGAAAAPVLNEANVPAHIEIVDTTPPKAQTKKAEQTVIPF